MLLKSYTQYTSKFGKPSSGHRTGKGQISFQSQRKAMPKNAQTTAQLHSSHSCLENPMDGGAWWAAVHGVAKSRTQLSDFTFTCMHWRRKWQPTPVFLPGESQGRGSLGGLPSMGSCRVGHDWSNLAAAAAACTSKVMLKILQARLQEYVNWELPHVQAGFRKGRGTRDQIAYIHWIIESKRLPAEHILLLHWLR